MAPAASRSRSGNGTQPRRSLGSRLGRPLLSQRPFAVWASGDYAPDVSTEVDDCPSDDRLLAFAEGLLEDGERSGVERHLGSCDECVAVLSATYAETPSDCATIGRYQVLEELGHGAMGRVWRAHDPALDRTVAIKVILPAVLSPVARERFAREAETLGSLQHGNLIEVFDYGVCSDRPYFVMEFVEGENLDQWCAGRPTREILNCLIEAGRGLSAAHAAGVLHRDFKPSNVMVQVNGHPKVGDFGLAGLEGVVTFGGGRRETSSLTNTGAVMGTLPYLAPELLDGGSASPASDQYALCVASFEVLYGMRPLAGVDARALSASIRRGDIARPTANHSVPRRVHQALLRGLSTVPSDRFPSVDALLRELGHLRSTRVPLGITAGVGAVAVVGGLFVLGPTQTQRCSGLASKLDAVYDQGAREGVRSAFAGAKISYAEPTMRSTLDGLDDYALSWRAASVDTCHAVEREELSDREFDLRMRCLTHALHGLDAAVQLLRSGGDAEVLEGSGLVASLPLLNSCIRDNMLERSLLSPRNDVEAQEAETLSPLLSHAQAKIRVGDFKGGWALLQEHEGALQAATYPPVRVRAMRARGQIHIANQALDRAWLELVTAHELAVEHGLDREVARTATLLAGLAPHRGQKSARWFELALSVERSRGFTHLEADTLLSMSIEEAHGGDLDAAVQAGKEAIEVVERDETYPDASRAALLLNYADRVFDRGAHDDGLAEVQEAKALVLELNGDTHPLMASIQRSLHARASRRGDYRAGLHHGREALRIAQVVHGPGSEHSIAGRVNLSIAFKELGRLDDAVAELRIADTLVAELGKPWLNGEVAVLVNLGATLHSMGRYGEARSVLNRARRLVDGRTDHLREHFVTVLSTLGAVELRDGNIDAARRFTDDALTASKDIYGENHFRTAETLARLAHIELEAEEFDLASEHLHRSLAVEDITEADRGWRTFLLARTIDEDPGQDNLERAIDLANEAIAALIDKPAYAGESREVQAWLAQHKIDDRTRPQ